MPDTDPTKRRKPKSDRKRPPSKKQNNEKRTAQENKSTRKREKRVSNRKRIPFNFVKKVNELKAELTGHERVIEKIMFPFFYAQEKNIEDYYYFEFVKADANEDHGDCFVVTANMNGDQEEELKHMLETADRKRIVVASGFYVYENLKVVLEYAKRHKKRVTIDPVGLSIRTTRENNSMDPDSVDKLKTLISDHAGYLDVCFERLVETLYLANNRKHFSETRNDSYKQLLLHIYKEVARIQEHDIYVRIIDEDNFENHENILRDLHSILENVSKDSTIIFWNYDTPSPADVSHFLPEKLRHKVSGMLARVPLNARGAPGTVNKTREKQGLGPSFAYESYGHQKANAVPIEPLDELL